MDLMSKKRRFHPVRGKSGEDGDFVQLRLVREKRRLLEESRKSSERNETSFSSNGSRLQGTDRGATEQPSAVTLIEEIRANLFKEVEENNKASMMLLLNQMKQEGPLTSHMACNPDTTENVWLFAVSRDKKEIIKFLLEHEDESLIMSHHKINRSGIQGKNNALHILTERNDIEMIKLVLKRISSPEKKPEMLKTETAVEIQGQRPRLLSCLHLAAFHGHSDLVGFFVNKGMAVNYLNGKKDTALLWAARWGHYDTVNNLLDRGADPEVKNDKGSTALYWAVRYEHEKIVALLLEKGEVNPNTTRKLGLVAPLVVAAAYGNNSIVKLLLTHPKCDVNIRIRGGETPIHHASREGYTDVLLTLLENGAYLNDVDELGDTPLLLAAQNEHINMVNKLITLGADVLHRNQEGNDVWNYAINSDKNHLLEALLAASKENMIVTASKRPFCIAASGGKIDKIDFLLKVDQNPLETDTEGNTFLHHAAMNDKHEVIVKYMSIIPIDTINKKGNTPLHIACSKGFTQTIKSLLECKAKADIQNNEGETPLHVAAYSKYITAETVRDLVTYTITTHSWESLNAKDYKGNNSLHIAGKFAKPDVIWEFRFVRFKDRDNDGFTPLHEAVRPGEPECLDTMLDIFETMKRDARINEQSFSRSETVLHLAASEGLSACVMRLIDLGADLSVQDVDGNTVLHRLIEATELNPRYLKRHLDVFDTVLSGVVKWWYIWKNIHYPEDSQTDYLRLKRDAILHLIHDIYNKEGLSVLALCFRIGTSDILSRVLMMPDITVFEESTGGKDQLVFDISRLTPRTNTIPNIEDVVEENEEEFTDKMQAEYNKEKTCLSGIELLITQKAKNQAAEVLDLPPVKVIENYYISIVFRIFAILMVLHVAYMSIFTFVGVDLLGKLRENENMISISDPSTLLCYVVIPIEPAIILIYVVYSLIRFAIYGHFIRQSNVNRHQGIWHVVSVMSEHILLFIGVVYAAVTTAWLILFSLRYEYHDHVLAAAICIGWLLSITITRGFKPIHYFCRMLISMIMRDVVRFIIVYFFVLLAFGCAFHLLFQVSPSVASQYKSTGDSLFLSLNLMIGMGELFDDTLETGMSDVGRNTTYLKGFYVLYMILSTVIFLNLLIAMMNDSYVDILEQQQVTWRIDSVSLGVAIERSIPAGRIFSKVSIVQGAEDELALIPQGFKGAVPGRWYVTVDRAEVEAIDRQRDMNSETTEEELNRRLEKIENSTAQFQKHADAKLQQINDTLETLTSKR